MRFRHSLYNVLSFSVLLQLSSLRHAFGAEITINTAQQLISLSNAVNSGTNYSGTTVLLGSDIDFTGKTMNPIGTLNDYFLGTFDGMGHVISNFKMTSSYQVVGLFGLSYGLTIKNFVLDTTCSVVGTFVSDNVYVGGIIGECLAYYRPCDFESTVNMASVSFGMKINDYSLHLGGIAGSFWAYKSSFFIVKNCANYGHLMDTGTYTTNHNGGIAGICGGEVTNNYVQNCANYGTITVSSATTLSGYKGYLRTGGIVGECNNVYVANCLSAGKNEVKVQKRLNDRKEMRI